MVVTLVETFKEGKMKENVAKVLNGFIKLTDQEKQELIEQVKEYYSSPFSTKERVQKSLNESHTINFGPAPSACPCCGK